MTFQGTGLNWSHGKIAALLSLLIVAALTNGGCSLVILSHDIEATDLTPVRVGATRAEVEKVLGEPVASEAKGTQYVVTYEYDRGQQHVPSKEYLDGYGIIAHPLTIILLEPILTPVAFAKLARRVNAQKGRLPVTYGPDDKVIRVGPPEVWTSPEELLSRARQGDAEAQYRVAMLAEKGKRRAWLCRAAGQNHPLAAAQLGLAYKLGLDGVEKDPIEAYKWYSLAGSHGLANSDALLAKLSTQMTPAEIAEAERLIHEWRLDPSSCELEVDQAAGGG